jgi:hypothetical protein
MLQIIWPKTSIELPGEVTGYFCLRTITNTALKIDCRGKILISKWKDSTDIIIIIIIIIIIDF